MIHYLRRVIVTAMSVGALVLWAGQLTAQEFKNQEEAKQYINDFNAVIDVEPDLMQPLRNLTGLMRSEFNAFRDAVNTSHSIEETEARYQTDVQKFKDARAEFDQAIAKAERLRANAATPEVQALADRYIERLTSGQNRVNEIAVAFMYHDGEALKVQILGLKSDGQAFKSYWKSRRKHVKAKLREAKAHFKRVYEPEVTDCPYEEGTRSHALHCILGQPMSTGTGE